MRQRLRTPPPVPSHATGLVARTPLPRTPLQAQLPHLPGVAQMRDKCDSELLDRLLSVSADGGAPEGAEAALAAFPDLGPLQLLADERLELDGARRWMRQDGKKKKDDALPDIFRACPEDGGRRDEAADPAGGSIKELEGRLDAYLEAQRKRLGGVGKGLKYVHNAKGRYQLEVPHAVLAKAGGAPPTWIVTGPHAGPRGHERQPDAAPACVVGAHEHQRPARSRRPPCLAHAAFPTSARFVLACCRRAFAAPCRPRASRPYQEERALQLEAARGAARTPGHRVAGAAAAAGSAAAGAGGGLRAPHAGRAARRRLRLDAGRAALARPRRHRLRVEGPRLLPNIPA